MEKRNGTERRSLSNAQAACRLQGAAKAPASIRRMAAALPASSSVLGRAQSQCVYVCCAPGVGAGVLLQTESTYRN